MGHKIGKVYRIVKNDDPTINYIGSTFSELKVRWRWHRSITSECAIIRIFNNMVKMPLKSY